MKDDSPATKGDLAAALKALRKDIDAFKSEIVHEFKVIAEQLRHDLIGIHRDKISLISDKAENHEVRIRRLESVTGVAA